MGELLRDADGASICDGTTQARMWIAIPQAVWDQGSPVPFAGSPLSQRSPASTRRLSPLRGSKRLHQLSKRWADSREIRALAGVQALDEFVKYDADLWRNASAYKGLGKSASYCFEQ